MEIIKPIPRFCYTIGELPTSYLMSMTYEEQLTWLCNFINKQIIPIVNANNEAISSIPEFKEYVNEQLANFQDILNGFSGDIDEINQKIREYDSKINELESIINNNYNILRDYINYNVDVLNYRIDNLEIGAIQVYNPTTGLLSPLQEVINDLYGVTNKDGLTASEFDALDLTASGFDAYEITAFNFDSQGKNILV